MNEPKVIDYVMTNGLKAEHALVERPFMAQVVFAIMSDDSVVVTVESARNGNRINICGEKIISRDHLRDMPDDPYDKMAFNHAAFDLMELTIC